MRTILTIIGLLLATPALAQECPTGSVCVERGDLDTFLKLAEDHGCRAAAPPKVTADNITIILDRMGRVYGSGTGPRPFKIHLDWCNYQIDLTSNLNLMVAQRVEPDWGFRLRLKPTFGFLVTEAFHSGTKFHETLDGGVLVEPFYVYDANLNVYVGVRSFGAGVGYDLFKNMTLYAGYGMTWGSWRSSPYVGVGFSLW